MGRPLLKLPHSSSEPQDRSGSMEAQGFVSKFQQLGKAGRLDLLGVGLAGITVVPDKPLELKSISPYSSVTLSPDNPGYTATPELSPLCYVSVVPAKNLQKQG